MAGASSDANSFNNQFGMSSSPGALDGTSLDTSLTTSSFATMSSSISGYGFLACLESRPFGHM